MMDEDGAKYLTVGRLIELLNTLPLDNRVVVSDVGSMLIDSSIGCPLGFIDFVCDGEVILWNENTDEDIPSEAQMLGGDLYGGCRF